MIGPGAMMIGGTLQKQDDIVKISHRWTDNEPRSIQVHIPGFSFHLAQYPLDWGLDAAFRRLHKRFYGRIQP
jgi:hypothetical protein